MTCSISKKHICTIEGTETGDQKEYMGHGGVLELKQIHSDILKMPGKWQLTYLSLHNIEFGNETKDSSGIDFSALFKNAVKLSYLSISNTKKLSNLVSVVNCLIYCPGLTGLELSTPVISSEDDGFERLTNMIVNVLTIRSLEIKGSSAILKSPHDKYPSILTPTFSNLVLTDKQIEKIVWIIRNSKTLQSITLERLNFPMGSPMIWSALKSNTHLSRFIVYQSDSTKIDGDNYTLETSIKDFFKFNTTLTELSLTKINTPINLTNLLAESLSLNGSILDFKLDCCIKSSPQDRIVEQIQTCLDQNKIRAAKRKQTLLQLMLEHYKTYADRI